MKMGMYQVVCIESSNTVILSCCYSVAGFISALLLLSCEVIDVGIGPPAHTL